MSNCCRKPHAPEGVSNSFSPSPYVSNLINQLQYNFSTARSLGFCSFVSTLYAGEHVQNTKATRRERYQAQKEIELQCRDKSCCRFHHPDRRGYTDHIEIEKQSIQGILSEPTGQQATHPQIDDLRRDFTGDVHEKRKGGSSGLIHIQISEQEQQLRRRKSAESLPNAVSASNNRYLHPLRLPPHTGDGKIAASKCDCTNPKLNSRSTLARQAAKYSRKKKVLCQNSLPPFSHTCCSPSNSCNFHLKPKELPGRSSTFKQKVTSPISKLRKEIQNLTDDEKFSFCQSKILEPYKRAKTTQLESKVIALFKKQYQRLNMEGVSISSELPPPLQSDQGSSSMLGCPHYARNCKLKASCCGLFVPCRFCHDEAMGDDHEMDRFSVEVVLCSVCLTEQPISSKCRKCGVSFGHYFCSECRFFENTPGKKVYHCDKCNICRVGEGLGIDNYHCEQCDSCVNMKSRDHHRCQRNSLRSNCPICAGYLFTSREPVVFMRCGHTMHSRCFDEYISRSYQCPLCMRSLTDMSTYFNRLDEIVAANPMPPEYRKRRSVVFCNDCSEKSKVAYHFDYHKCGKQTCGSYNTKVLETVEDGPALDSDTSPRELERGEHECAGDGRSDGESELGVEGAVFASDVREPETTDRQDETEDKLPGDRRRLLAPVESAV